MKVLPLGIKRRPICSKTHREKDFFPSGVKWEESAVFEDHDGEKSEAFFSDGGPHSLGGRRFLRWGGKQSWSSRKRWRSAKA